MSETKKLNVGDNSPMPLSAMWPLLWQSIPDRSARSHWCRGVIGHSRPGSSCTVFPCTKGNEEVYIFLSGRAHSKLMEILSLRFRLCRESLHRGFPQSKNNSNEPMVYICIQAKEGSLDCCTADDAIVTETESKL